MKCHCGSFVIKSYWKTGSYLTKCPKCNSTGMIQDKPYERKSTNKVGKQKKFSYIKV